MSISNVFNLVISENPIIHLGLIKKAKKKKSTIIVTIFVNPKQFNDKKDLVKYPKTFVQASILLNEALPAKLVWNFIPESVSDELTESEKSPLLIQRHSSRIVY